MANVFKQFTEFLTGKTYDAVSGTASAATDLATSTGDAAEETKKATKAQKGYLSGLDEVKTYSDQSSDSTSGTMSSGGVTGGLIGDIEGSFGDLEESASSLAQKMAEQLKWAAEQIKEGFADAFRADPKELLANIKSIGDSIVSVWTSEEVQESMVEFEESTLEMLGAISGSISSIITSFSVGITGGVADALKSLEGFNKVKLSSIFGNLTNITDTIKDLVEYAAEVATAFESEGFKNIVEVVAKITDAVILEGLDELTGLFSDLFKLAVKPLVDNKDKFRELLSSSFDLISALLIPVEDLMDAITGASGKYENGALHAFFEDVTSFASTGISTFLDGLNTTLETLTGFLKGDISIVDAIFPDADDIVLSMTADITSFKDSVKKKELDFKASITSFVNRIKNAVMEFRANITSFKDRLKSKAISFSAKIASFIDRIGSKKKYISFTAQIVNFVNKIKDKVLKFAAEITGFSTAKNVGYKIVQTAKGKETGGLFKNGQWQPIEGYASGGYPQSARLFYANENGIPELIGRIGNATAVMNNGQIVASVAAGVYKAVLTAMSQLASYFSSIAYSVGSIPIAIDSLISVLPNISFTPPMMASGSVIPPMLKIDTESIDDLKESIDRLIETIIGLKLSSGNSRDVYEFIAQINGKTLFDILLDEAKLRRLQSGKNPFELT